MQVSNGDQAMSQPRVGKPEISSGTLIDNRYLIQEMLGQGGLGRTYVAFDTRRFNEPCVLKEFAPCGSGAHSLQKSRALFKREAEILYKIHHPQIPNFLACFEGDGRLFLVQEYVEGKTYSSILKDYRNQRLRFSEEAVVDWLNKLLPVLEYIHNHGIIHRDISPDNILLPAGQDLPVLIDFGVGQQVIARDCHKLDAADDQQESSYVGKMSLVGKIGYAPHEQIRLGICSASSDLYALGVTAVVLLTCKDPCMLMHQYSLQWQWRLHCDVTPEFGCILDKMLADTPAERYQAAAEVIADLANLGQIEATTLSLPEPQSFISETTMLVAPPTVLSSQPACGNGNGSMSAGQWGGHLTPLRIHPELETHQDPTEDSFKQRCQELLSYYIGPMAAFIVDEFLASEPNVSPIELVNRLAQEIPSPQEALEFRKKIFS